MSHVLSLLGVRPLRSAGAILCFHSVTTPSQPAEGVVHVSLEQFEALVTAARRIGQLVTLRELVQRHVEGRSTAGLIAITADDAYVSLLDAAADILRREAVPLTVFAVIDAAASGAPYWWDRLDDVFPRVPKDRWRAFEDACGLPEAYRKGQPVRFGPLRPFRQWMLAAHSGRWPRELDPLLRDLEDETKTRTLQRPMTFDELARFAALPAIDVGVHTLSHPVLPLLPDTELEREIATAYRALRERFVNVVPILGVPFGLFDPRTVCAAREAGMTASLTLSSTTLARYRGRADLPRFCLARSDAAATLERRLIGLLDWVRSGRLGAPPTYTDLPSPRT